VGCVRWVRCSAYPPRVRHIHVNITVRETYARTFLLWIFKHTGQSVQWQKTADSALYTLYRIWVSCNKSQQRTVGRRHKGHFKRQEPFQLLLQFDYFEYIVIKYVFRTWFSVVGFKDEILFSEHTQKIKLLAFLNNRNDFGLKFN
jgi:hypothetical protein